MEIHQEIKLDSLFNEIGISKDHQKQITSFFQELLDSQQTEISDLKDKVSELEDTRDKWAEDCSDMERSYDKQFDRAERLKKELEELKNKSK